jgi:hypothetical protein
MLEDCKDCSLDYIRNNVITAKLNIGNEVPINQDHLYNIVHSEIMDCNPHTKVKYQMEPISEVKKGKLFIFIPSSATEPIVIPKGREPIVIDIRSLDLKGKSALKMFSNIVSDFKVSAESAMGKTGYIHMSPSYISNSPNAERQKCPLAGRDVTVLIDRYTLFELDEYCSMLIAYFYKHFKVKGEPHKMYKYVFKEILLGNERKHCVAIPVLKLNYPRGWHI